MPVRYLSTTTPFFAAPSSHRGDGRSHRGKGGAPARPARPPAPGERKALRKRIILNNPNALEIQGLQDLTADKLLDKDAEGSVVAIPGEVVDQLRDVGAFKPTQRWGSFRKPAILLSKQMMDMARDLDGIGRQGEGGMVRRVFTGERGVGKSTMLLHATAMAFLKGWIVISVPECQDLTIGHTDYAPIPDTTPIQYIQKTYTASLLSQIAKANGQILSNLRVSKPHSLDVPISSNLSLAGLAKLGAQDPDIAWPIFQALWTELTTPSEANKPPRPPLMITLDSINHIMRLSHYRDAHFNLIHAHNLSLVHHLLSYLSGAQRLPNGGAVLGATSKSNHPSTPTFSLALRQAEARAATETDDVPRPSPFEEQDEHVMRVMSNVDVVKLRGLDRRETRALLEYYAASGVLREVVDERNVAEKWTLAGGGVVGEVEKVALTRSF